MHKTTEDFFVSGPFETFVYFVVKLQRLLGFLDEAFELTAEGDFLDGRHAVDQQDAVEVIKLMLNGAGEQSPGVEGLRMPIKIGIFYIDFIPAFHIREDVGKTQASLLPHLYIIGMACDPGVDKHERHPDVGIFTLPVFINIA